jgi:predicted  nucleic acid-binding Zn-ribbon protein
MQVMVGALEQDLATVKVQLGDARADISQRDDRVKELEQTNKSKQQELEDALKKAADKESKVMTWEGGGQSQYAYGHKVV